MITVFTPTYNRKNDLKNLYQSLIDQSYKEFIWVLMDDGSSDGTRDMVQNWINDGIIKIKYGYQLNHGRFAAFNNAQSLFEGDLMCIVDSDDRMLPDGLMKLHNTWGGRTEQIFWHPRICRKGKRRTCRNRISEGD